MLRSKAVVLASLTLLAVAFYLFVVDLQGRALVDFAVYVDAAKRYAAGDTIYQHTYIVRDRWDRDIDSFYFYPPLLAHVLAVLLPLGEVGLIALWSVVSFLCLLLSAYVLAKISAGSWWGRFPLRELFLIHSFFLLCYEPVYWGVSDGQVTAIILLCLVIFAAALTQGRQTLAGAALGTAVAIKMSPLILCLALLRFRRWRALFVCTVVTLALIILPPLFTGRAYTLAQFWQSLTAVVDDESRRAFVFNFVFDKALLDLLGLQCQPLARMAVKAVLLLAAVLYAWGWKQEDSRGEIQLVSAMVCFMVLCSPILWFHHLAWLLLPLAALSMSARDGELRMKDLTLVLAIYFASSQVNLMHYWALREAPDALRLTSLIPGVLIIVLLLCLRRYSRLDTPAAQQGHKVPR